MTERERGERATAGQSAADENIWVKCPGCREIARAGVNALLVPPDDAQALADAIGRLATDQVLRARFGAAGRALVEREFSSAQIGRAVVDLYRRLLEGGGAAGPLRAPRRTR